jgi:tRNA isopentenyl-2-thiomethyl-A-37 hydroxylase MiaE
MIPTESLCRKKLRIFYLSFFSSEIRKLQELQNIASKNFRQDLAQKLRRQKSKASYLKEKFGLGTGAAAASRFVLIFVKI